MRPFHIFVLSHKKEILTQAPSGMGLEHVWLPGLDLPAEFQINALGEHRAFLAELEPHADAHRVGYLNGRLDNKYGPHAFDKALKLAERLQPQQVLRCWPARTTWRQQSDGFHKGMGVLIERLASQFSLRASGQSLWANDFVCSRELWEKWRAFWREAFAWCWHEFGLDPPYASDNLDKNRKPAYLYERIGTLFWANQDVEFVDIAGTKKA
jgi:hypothetical protein